MLTTKIIPTETPLVFSCFVDTTVHLQSTQPNAYVHNRILIGQILHLSSQVVFSIEITFCVHSRLGFCVHQRASDGYCTQDFSVVYTRVQNAFLCDLSRVLCVHKSTYWNVVNTRVHQQFYCVSCGGINNLICIFSLQFDIR